MELTEIAASFKIRASGAHEIMAGNIGLTEKQEIRIKELSERDSGSGKPLTVNMKMELAALQNLAKNPELPQGAKTYCKNWLKEKLYGRRTEIKSKYINKGNVCEEDGFTVMALQLNLGMVYKNTERKSNDYAEGECDLSLSRVVYDNKCSWSLDTFPMFETECPDPKYQSQLDVYAWLWLSTEMVLCYTLVNATYEMVQDAVKWETEPDRIYKRIEEMIFTKKEFDELCLEFCPLATRDTFIEIPEEKRIKPFYFKPDPVFIEDLKKRVVMCRTYINSLINNK